VKEQFERLAARFDALALRERGLIFGGVLLGVIVLFYLLALEPKLVAKKRLTPQLTEAQKMLATLQSLKAQSYDPVAARRAERDALRKQLADIDKTMGQIQRGLVPAERTARLLEEVLRGSRGLQLVSMRTLPVQRFDPRGGPGGEANLAQDAAERQLYQHSFEMTLQGSYAEVYDYLRRAEQLPWRLFWSRIRVAVDPEQHPKLTVTVTVQTLSLSKAWLIV
jgi:MSHA biogenesis protein MshJ